MKIRPAARVFGPISVAAKSSGRRRLVIDANGNKAELIWDRHDRQLRWSLPSKTVPVA